MFLCSYAASACRLLPCLNLLSIYAFNRDLKSHIHMSKLQKALKTECLASS